MPCAPIADPLERDENLAHTDGMHINHIARLLLRRNTEQAETLPNIAPRSTSPFHFDEEPRQGDKQEERIDDVVENEKQEANHETDW